MYDALAGWARIDAPQIYAEEYGEFRRGWTSAFDSIYFDFPGDRTFTIALVLWRLAQHNPARKDRTRKAMDQALGRINRSLGTVVVDSIAMSVPACRRAADDLRDEIADAEPA